jgi:hypothetical protein
MRDVYRLPINSQTGFVEKLAMYNFAGGADEAVACASLFQNRARNLYGATYQGGDYPGSCSLGCGVLFKLSP